MQVLGGHRKEVTGLSVHCSGKLALSTSRDSTLRMWDLVKGRCSTHSKLALAAEAVAFSPTDLYALLLDTHVVVHAVADDGAETARLTHSRRATCLAWRSPEQLLTGTEDGAVICWDARTGAAAWSVAAHRSRIRGLTVLSTLGLQRQVEAASDADGHAAKAGDTCDADMMATAASDGSIKLWRLATGDPEELASISTRARITCLCATVAGTVLAAQANPDQKRLQSTKSKGKKRKAGLAVAADSSHQQDPGRKVTKKQKQPKVEQAALAQDGISIKGVVDFTIPTTGQSPIPNQLSKAFKHSAGTKNQSGKKKGTHSLKASRTMKQKR